MAFANYFGDIFQQPAYIRKGETEPFLPPLVLTLSNASYLMMGITAIYMPIALPMLL